MMTSPPGAPSGDELPPGYVTHRVEVSDDVDMRALLGPRDEVLRALERGFGEVEVHVRGSRVALTGPRSEVALAEQLVDELAQIARTGAALTADAVDRAIAMLRSPAATSPASVMTMNILSNRGRTIRPKTLGQKEYVEAIDRNTVTFGIGPAGTGKTYLAMAKAVQALQAKQVSRILLTRPAVEAGERLGFLPGSLTEKIDPYLRPLYDALHDMLEGDSIPRLMASGVIEVAPLAYMRGRTLNDAFIVLDEAQNTTPEQMKMFLTRLGFGSTMVVTGDVTQVDLPGGATSGLRVVSEILSDIDDIAFCRLTSADVVRHRLVGDIIDAYARWDEATTSQAGVGARGANAPRGSGGTAGRDRNARDLRRHGRGRA